MASKGALPTKTLAAVLYKTGQAFDIRVEEIVLPQELTVGQVLVKMRAAGLCHTQLSEALGLKGEDKYLPHLLGHEASATVLAVGPGVTKVRVKDYVVLSWIKGAGKDAPGGPYFNGKQKINAGGVAVFTDYAVVAENRVTKIPPSVPADVAALLGCAVATGAGVVKNTLAAKKGMSLAVFGVGGVGASAVMMGAALGCKPLIAVDISAKKLQWAKQLGATHTINALKQNPVEAIKKLVPGGLDFAAEASGIPEVMEQAMAAIRPGGKLAIAGHPAHGLTMKIDPFDLIQGKQIVGTWGGGTVPERDIPFYIRQWRAEKMPLEKLITHRWRLKDIHKALQTLAKGQAGRILLEW